MARSESNGAAQRRAQRHRVTAESDVFVEIDLDGTGAAEIGTGLPFFDHMLSQLARHGGVDLVVRARGDLEVDAHHCVEDTGITLGEAFADALGDKVGVRRFASIVVPLDESAVSVAVDLSGRAYLEYSISFPDEVAPLGTPGFHPQLGEEFWRAFVSSAQLTADIDLVRGKNLHHILEASFKAVARALRDAVRVESDVLPSTKGVL